MTTESIKDQIIDELDSLSLDQQEHLLDVARRLKKSPLPAGTPGSTLLTYLDDFSFAPGEVDAMMRVIEEDCERIDWDGWR